MEANVKMSSTPVCAACGCDPIYHRRLTELAAERDRLQAAVDTAASAMRGSEYVGGPTVRDAWRTAYAALCEVETQHVGQEGTS